MQGEVYLTTVNVAHVAAFSEFDECGPITWFVFSWAIVTSNCLSSMSSPQIRRVNEHASIWTISDCRMLSILIFLCCCYVFHCFSGLLVIIYVVFVKQYLFCLNYTSSMSRDAALFWLLFIFCNLFQLPISAKTKHAPNIEVYESTFSLHQKICRGEKGTVWSNALALHRGAQVLSCGSDVSVLRVWTLDTRES